MKSSQKELFKWAEQIPEVLWHDVKMRSPQQAAEAVGAVWDGNTFKLPLIGIEHTLDPANQRITKTSPDDQPVCYQSGVVLLTTLAASKGVPPSGRMSVPQDLPGGRMFFTGAHALATDRVAQAFERDPNRLLNRALDVGGERIDGADVAFQLPGLPYVPLYILLFRGNSEFPARAVMGLDDRALFHLDLASIFALTNLLVNRLCKAV
jgi:hypothetical protein